jgi:hypothetical protein
MTLPYNKRMKRALRLGFGERPHADLGLITTSYAERLYADYWRRVRNSRQ